MRIQVMSDLHMEFGWGRGDDFMNHLEPDGIDVLILAGDICVSRNMVDVIGAFCRLYKDSTVIWIHGNHEYYQSDRDTVCRLSKQCEKENLNLRWLDNTAVEVNGQRFLGGTMWFEDTPENKYYKHSLNDFHLIRDFEKWVYVENTKTKKFIESECRPGDIVITHHLPADESVASMYRGDKLNRFYLCDVRHLMVKNAPKLWIHGHTHDSCRYKVTCEGGSECEVICNPRGYWRHQLNHNFVRDLIVDV